MEEILSIQRNEKLSKGDQVRRSAGSNWIKLHEQDAKVRRAANITLGMAKHTTWHQGVEALYKPFLLSDLLTDLQDPVFRR